MKKIAMFTMGTRGDVQPYIYLARALKNRGYKVVLGSHPCWKSLIEEADIEFAPIGPDIDIEKETTIIRGKNPNVAMSMIKTMKFVFRIIKISTNDVYEICQGCDLIIVTHSQIGATEAAALNKPTVNVTLQTQMIPQKLKRQKPLEKIIGTLISAQTAKPFNRIRKIYDLPKLRPSDDIISKRLNLIPASKYVLERNPYWEKQHVITGYWYEDQPDYAPDKALTDFLDKGAKPIILALGAMSFETRSDKEKLNMFVSAFQRTGMRAVIQGFEKTMSDYTLPETMIHCGSVPHSWLFRQGWCAVHHCGFGTASASLIYAIPSIPIPHVLDQYGFAQQLVNCQTAVEPIMAKALNEERIVQAVEEMKKTYFEKKDKADEISEKIRSENGLEYAVDLIEKVLKERGDGI